MLGWGCMWHKEPPTDTQTGQEPSVTQQCPHPGGHPNLLRGARQRHIHTMAETQTKIQLCNLLSTSLAMDSKNKLALSKNVSQAGGLVVHCMYPNCELSAETIWGLAPILLQHFNMQCKFTCRSMCIEKIKVLPGATKL